MNSKEKLIIEKLFKIAQNQQKVLTKLAQAVSDPNVDYLKRAAEVAAMNTRLNGTSFSVTSQPGSSAPGPEGSNTQIMGGYTVTVHNAPNDNGLRQKFMDTLKTQVKTQKPDLSNFSIIFS